MALSFAIIWLPIISIFGVVLWLQVSSLNYLKKQRTLDRYVYQKLKLRCQMLNQLSLSNQKLTWVIHSLAAIKMAKTIGIAIPGMGVGGVLLSGLSETSLKTLAHALIRYQDFLIMTHHLFLRSFAKEPKFERQKTTESQFVGMGGPLVWVNGISSSEIHVSSRDFSVQSFGYCHGSAKLQGESYFISFQHPDKPL